MMLVVGSIQQQIIVSAVVNWIKQQSKTRNTLVTVWSRSLWATRTRAWLSSYLPIQSVPGHGKKSGYAPAWLVDTHKQIKRVWGITSTSLTNQNNDKTGFNTTSRMAAGSRLPRSSHGIFLLSSTFQTYFVKFFVRPPGIQALPLPVTFHHNEDPRGLLVFHKISVYSPNIT